MEYVNKEAKDTADLMTKITVPWSNACAFEFTIYSDDSEEALELWFDYLLDNEYTVHLEELDEAECNDYFTMDGMNYFPHAIMRDYVQEEENPDKKEENDE